MCTMLSGTVLEALDYEICTACSWDSLLTNVVSHCNSARCTSRPAALQWLGQETPCRPTVTTAASSAFHAAGNPATVSCRSVTPPGSCVLCTSRSDYGLFMLRSIVKRPTDEDRTSVQSMMETLSQSEGQHVGLYNHTIGSTSSGRGIDGHLDSPLYLQYAMLPAVLPPYSNQRQGRPAMVAGAVPDVKPRAARGVCTVFSGAVDHLSQTWIAVGDYCTVEIQWGGTREQLRLENHQGWMREQLDCSSRAF